MFRAWIRSPQVYVNLALPEQAETAASIPSTASACSGAEFLLTEALGGVHPQPAHRRRPRRRVRRAAWPPRCCRSPVRSRLVRSCTERPTSAATSSATSTGGDEFEPTEENPMIGYRGCFRYVHDPELFRLELETLARVREETPNLHLMIPFVRTRWELERCLELVDASPLGRQRGLHRWVMAEVPSVVFRIPEYAALGIDGVSIGSNDLTQLMLGRRSRLPAVRRALRRGRRRGARRDPTHHRRALGSRASPRRCAGRHPRTGRSSRTTSCASASIPSR